MFPNIALTTVSHVHRDKQILLLTCELSLPERLPSEATMINRRWEENFTGKKQYFFVSVNMRNYGQRNVRKYREIKDSDECVTLNMNEILKISEKFDNLDKMETTSSESKVKI